MDNKKYIRSLNRKLVDLDRKSRKNIIAEIQAAADDNIDQSLETRFGDVDILASNYLEGIMPKTNVMRFFNLFFKWIFIGLGILFVLIVAIVIYFSSDRDEFDYGNINAPELSEMVWRPINVNPDRLNFFQAEVILYASEDDQLSYACERPENKQTSGIEGERELEIMHDRCFIKLPKTVKRVSSRQSSVVLTGLNSDKTINIFQTKLRLAQDKDFKLDLNVEMSDIKDLGEIKTITETGEHTLSISGTQSKITKY